MNPEQHNVQFDDLAQVLHDANLRRSVDLGLWLKEYLHRRREINMLAATADRRNKGVTFIAHRRHRAV